MPARPQVNCAGYVGTSWSCCVVPTPTTWLNPRGAQQARWGVVETFESHAPLFPGGRRAFPTLVSLTAQVSVLANAQEAARKVAGRCGA